MAEASAGDFKLVHCSGRQMRRLVAVQHPTAASPESWTTVLVAIGGTTIMYRTAPVSWLLPMPDT
jgi:hypothetical protein